MQVESIPFCFACSQTFKIGPWWEYFWVFFQLWTPKSKDHRNMYKSVSLWYLVLWTDGTMNMLSAWQQHAFLATWLWQRSSFLSSLEPRHRKVFPLHNNFRDWIDQLLKVRLNRLTIRPTRMNIALARYIIALEGDIQCTRSILEHVRFQLWKLLKGSKMINSSTSILLLTLPVHILWELVQISKIWYLAPCWALAT